MKNISYYAIITIIKFRIFEYFKEYNYTIISPLVNITIFVVIFSTIENYYSLQMDDISFIEFIIPGLILMVVVQESFDNASNSLVHMKLIGSLNDLLSAPIERFEIFFAYIISSIFIGIFLGILVYFSLLIFNDFENFNIFYFFYYMIASIVFFSSLGSIVGLLSYTWDTQSSVSNFFVTPINLLSGTFFSISALPISLNFLFTYNPYYYVVKNFRLSFYDNFQFNIIENLTILFFVFISIIIGSIIFVKGYRVIK